MDLYIYIHTSKLWISTFLSAVGHILLFHEQRIFPELLLNTYTGLVKYSQLSAYKVSVLEWSDSDTAYRLLRTLQRKLYPLLMFDLHTVFYIFGWYLTQFATALVLSVSLLPWK